MVIENLEKVSQNLKYAVLVETPGLENFYPSVITTGQIGQHHLETVLDILANGKLEERSVSILGYGRNLEPLAKEVVNDFVVRLCGHSVIAGGSL